MKLLNKFTAVTALALCAPLTAHATVLTFDLNPDVSNGQAPGNYGDNVSDATTDVDGTGAAAAGSYTIGAEGATPNVTIDYAFPTASGGEELVWTDDYSDLTNILYVEPDGLEGFAFELTADVGYQVELSSFTLGNYGSAVTFEMIAFVDFAPAWNVLDYMLGDFNSPSQVVTPTNENAGPDFGDPLKGSVITVYLDFTGVPAGNTDNIGLDNITFSQSVTGSVSQSINSTKLNFRIHGSTTKFDNHSPMQRCRVCPDLNNKHSKCINQRHHTVSINVKE